jgi:hypothetical protein
MALLKNLKTFVFEDITSSKNKAINTNELQKTNKKQNLVSNIKAAIIKNIGLLTFTSYNREAFIAPEYNLEEIRNASEADSYIKMALMKYSYLIYKAGWTLKGKDDAVEYINKRFRMMSFATGKPMDILFQEVADDMVRYSNAFLVKARVDSIPGIKAKPILENTKIVGGYYRVDPSSIIIERDKSGNVKRYRQGYGENERYFKPKDMIHFYMDRDANNAFGTPRIIAALEDVQLLRKIEGNIVSLIYRFSRPIFHWKIGIPQQGLQATDPEIREAQREAERMSYESMIITNEKTEIKAIGAEGTALNAEGYLKYFEERVFTALGVSATQMGRGSDKSSADSMDEQVHDVVKYIQRILATFYENFMLSEILLEGGYNPILTEEDIVTYEFEEISLETKIKKENHEMTRYQGNITTLDEARRKMGMKDAPENEERLYKNLIEKTTRLAEIDATYKHQKEMQDKTLKAQKETAKLSASNNSNNQPKHTTGGGSTKPKNTKSSGPNKDASNKNQPENQHGKTSVKVKESLEEKESFKGCTINNSKKEFNQIFKKYEDLRNDIKENADIDMVMPISKENMTNEIIKHINMYSINAVNDALNEIEKLHHYRIYPSTSPQLIEFEEEIDQSIKSLLEEIKDKIKIDQKDVDAVFDTYEYRLRFLTDYMVRKVYWYSFIKTAAACDVETAYILFNSEKDKENANTDIINTKAFSYDEIPAYHSFCDCKITLSKKKHEKHTIKK